MTTAKLHRLLPLAFALFLMMAPAGGLWRILAAPPPPPNSRPVIHYVLHNSRKYLRISDIARFYHFTATTRIIDELKKRADTLALDAVKVASDLGMPRGMNVVLLGALIAALGVDDVDWAAALKSCVKRQFFEPNLKCLEAGLKLAGKTE